ncbi:argininosuccinate lyase [Microbacterium sp. ISL-103]|uniref:argininosuccinate lyase n=1 Tax=Microbacterium sp. ISL-103 TaxID=2819156 RepID=UPI001BEB977B|nr:argininosuccinate lyase [Microbacterium sp. ISL-103]MBT2475811.1 argininosuccinate lyase [Microbacterium sp. ISL-103]
MLQQKAGTYRGFRTAGIRFTEDLLEDLEYHRTEKFSATLPGVHAFDKAHIVMLTEEGLIPAHAGSEILRLVRSMEKQGMEAVRLDAQGGEHSLEYFVIRELGEDIGGWINLGRSSGDLGEVARRFALRDRILVAWHALNTFRAALIGLSERHVDVVFPAQTFLQYAQPTSFGHWFGMWVEVLTRHTDRLASLHARVNESPAGAGILTGSDLPLDRHRTAALLGFDRPLANTFDAVLSHDINLESQSTLAAIWNDLARLGDDLEQWLASDTKFVDVPDRFCDTSSVMPQKRNPMLPQFMKAQATKALAMLTSGFLAERGATGQPMLERNEPETLLWELFDALPGVTRDLTRLLEELTPNIARMREASIAGWANASDLTSLVVRRGGLSWRAAHQIVGITVRLTEERQISPDEVTSELLDEAAEAYLGRRLSLSEDDIRTALEPAESVAQRTVYGGAAPSAQEEIRDEQRRRLDTHEWALEEARGQLVTAAAILEEAIDGILSRA